MAECAESYPAWSFESNKGYPCDKHIAALRAMAVGDPPALVGVHGQLRAVDGRGAATWRRAPDAVLNPTVPPMWCREVLAAEWG